MKTERQNIFNANGFDMDMLLRAAEKPELFSAGEPLFWNDPHISKKMLEAHLDPYTDAASRKPETIEKTVDWLMEALRLGKGSKLLDIGCGPGLYCTRFYNRGIDVTGVDFSENSIRYATAYAGENRMNIRYFYQNYLTMDFEEEFDAVCLIWCDFGALSNTDRDLLLQKVHRALKPGGVFAFDVFTKNMKTPPESNWNVCGSGFWRPGKHLELTQGFRYEKENVCLHQHIVIDDTGETAVYKIWDHYYSPESISEAIEARGFRVKDIRSDLTGKPYTESSEIIGVLAEKPE